MFDAMWGKESVSVTKGIKVKMLNLQIHKQTRILAHTTLKIV